MNDSERRKRAGGAKSPAESQIARRLRQAPRLRGGKLKSHSHFRKGSESVETIVSATGSHVRDDQLEDHLSLRSGTRLKILASAGLKVEVASETLCPQVLSTV